MASKTSFSTEDIDNDEDGTNLYTPTSSSNTAELVVGLNDLLSSLKMIESNTPCLWPEKTFLLLERDSKRVLALRDGKVRLIDQESMCMSDSPRNLSCHWRCVENSSRWWGLRNAVSGMYLGEIYPGEKPLRRTNILGASSPEFTESNRIHPRQHPDGDMSCSWFMARS